MTAAVSENWELDRLADSYPLLRFSRSTGTCFAAVITVAFKRFLTPTLPIEAKELVRCTLLTQTRDTDCSFVPRHGRRLRCDVGRRLARADWCSKRYDRAIGFRIFVRTIRHWCWPVVFASYAIGWRHELIGAALALVRNRGLLRRRLCGCRRPAAAAGGVVGRAGSALSAGLDLWRPTTWIRRYTLRGSET